MRLFEFNALVEGYKETKQAFLQVADKESVEKAIDKFRELVNKNQVTGNERNIDWWRKQGWEKFKNFVTVKSMVKTTSQIKKGNSGKIVSLLDNDEWHILVPLNKDASVYYGKGTDWCVTKPYQNYFETYFYDNKITLIFFLSKKSDDKWAIAVTEEGIIEYFDKLDNMLKIEQFDNSTNLNSAEYVKLAMSNEVQSELAENRNEYQKAKNEIVDLITHSINIADIMKHKEKIEATVVDLNNSALTTLYATVIKEGIAEGMIDPDTLKLPLAVQMAFIAAKTHDTREVLKRINLDPRAQKAWVTQWGGAILYMQNPSIELVKHAVNGSRTNIMYEFQNPSKEIVEYFLSINPYYISHVIGYYPNMFPADSLPQMTLDSFERVVSGVSGNLTPDFMKSFFNRVLGYANDTTADPGLVSKIMKKFIEKYQNIAYMAIMAYAKFMQRNVPSDIAKLVSDWLPEETRETLWS